jgi:hypothetical protein
MRRRIGITLGAVAASLAVLLGVGQLAGVGVGSAGAAAPARGWYIDSSGVPHFLPWRGETPGEASAYTWSGGKITSWYAGTLPSGAGASIAPTPSPSPSVTASASPSAAEETAPVLSSIGGLTATSVLLSWTRAVSPADTTIVGYVIEIRPSTAGTWASAPSATTDDAVTAFRVTGLTRATTYTARVRAKYGSGELGPTSNVVTGTTLPS